MQKDSTITLTRSELEKILRDNLQDKLAPDEYVSSIDLDDDHVTIYTSSGEAPF